jgi:hypothetical protein
MGTKHVAGNMDEDNYRELIAAVAPERARVTVGVTHNLGDFNSVRIDFSLEGNAKDGQSLEELAEELYAKAESLVEAKLTEYNE